MAAEDDEVQHGAASSQTSTVNEEVEPRKSFFGTAKRECHNIQMPSKEEVAREFISFFCDAVIVWLIPIFKLDQTQSAYVCAVGSLTWAAFRMNEYFLDKAPSKALTSNVTARKREKKKVKKSPIPSVDTSHVEQKEPFWYQARDIALYKALSVVLLLILIVIVLEADMLRLCIQNVFFEPFVVLEACVWRSLTMKALTEFDWNREVQQIVKLFFVRILGFIALIVLKSTRLEAHPTISKTLGQSSALPIYCVFWGVAGCMIAPKTFFRISGGVFALLIVLVPSIGIGYIMHMVGVAGMLFCGTRIVFEPGLAPDSFRMLKYIWMAPYMIQFESSKDARQKVFAEYKLINHLFGILVM